MTALGWTLFTLLILGLLILDLKVFHRRAHEIKLKEALWWSLFWTVLALIFNAGVWLRMGHVKGMEFFTAYIIERSLSVDNLFVFLAIFTYFKVPAKYQHGVLFWGIVGALVMRALFIFAGVALLNMFHWIMYAFGVILIYTAYKLAAQEQQQIDPSKNPVVNFVRRFLPVSATQDPSTFFVREKNRLIATPLLIVLLVIETSDVMFAFDSIPAVLAISRDPFIAYTSNIFAILGLRALYFAIADALRLFHYLNIGLAAILSFIGAKMLLTDLVHVPIWVTLAVVGGVLAVSVLASWIHPKKSEI